MIVQDRVVTIRGKVRQIEELPPILASLRAHGKKIVHCHGVFDLLHIGHIRHFQQARSLGDILVVTVTPDRYVNKGPHRPAFPEELRAEAIAALDCVDYVAVTRWPLAVEPIRLLRPDFYVKGPDYREAQKDRTGGIALEEAAIRSVGGQLVFTDDITFSSSSLINHHLPLFPREVSEYLAGFSTRYSADQVLRYLDGAWPLKVLVVGEAIIDEYQYCETIGKSGKEPILAAKYMHSERFAGGILAVANHVASFSERVGMLTCLGKRDSQEDFVNEKLNSRIEKMYLYAEDAPTIVKRRFVETYPFQKLFELYVMNTDETDAAQSEASCEKLREILPDYDVVIVADYGHGMLGPEAVEVLCDRARFLAVNTQANAANRGFNTISKYRRADYVCVSEHELRLEARSRRRDLRDIVEEVSRRLSCGHLLITRGQQGCLCYAEEEGFFEVPAMARNIVDRIGAGDAVLSVTALCVAQKAPVEVVGFIGNCVGGQAVATVANRSAIERVPLYRHVESLLK